MYRVQGKKKATVQWKWLSEWQRQNAIYLINQSIISMEFMQFSYLIHFFGMFSSHLFWNWSASLYCTISYYNHHWHDYSFILSWKIQFWVPAACATFFSLEKYSEFDRVNYKRFLTFGPSSTWIFFSIYSYLNFSQLKKK